MKIKNFTIYFFAIIGFVVIACSAAATADDDSPDDIAPIAQSNIGKYQIAISGSLGQQLHVINTETGKIKSYEKSGANSTDYSWVVNENGDLTVSH